ncbi:MAG TPA: DUF421 domain-containing protein [Clostridiaceae bacterium]|nr:DUF421 domain-containing protein [Clostridiaceae bacterium]
MLVVFVRTLILYVLVVLVMRLMGKRQIGQLQPFELVIAIMISELASVPMQNTGIPLVYGIIPIITLLAAQITISFISIKSNRGRTIICGRPTILIENGRILEEQLKKEMYTINDLLEQLRINNYPNISDVEYAILETNGQVSIIPKSQKRPVTPKDLNIPTEYEGISLDIIMDGDINYKNLAKAKLDINWLQAELEKLGIRSAKDVFYASLDSSGNLYCQKKSCNKVS